MGSLLMSVMVCMENAVGRGIIAMIMFILGRPGFGGFEFFTKTSDLR